MNKICKTKWEIENNVDDFSDFERISELSAEIIIESQDRWKKEILDKLSDVEIKDYISFYRENHKNTTKGIPESIFIKFAETELDYRYIFKRAGEIGLPYCVYHDCKCENCPLDSHQE